MLTSACTVVYQSICIFMGAYALASAFCSPDCIYSNTIGESGQLDEYDNTFSCSGVEEKAALLVNVVLRCDVEREELNHDDCHI